jgi:hypothetical protein
MGILRIPHLAVQLREKRADVSGILTEVPSTDTRRGRDIHDRRSVLWHNANEDIIDKPNEPRLSLRHEFPLAFLIRDQGPAGQLIDGVKRGIETHSAVA